MGSFLSDCTTPSEDPAKIFPILSDTELRAPERAPPILSPIAERPDAGPKLERVFFAVLTALVAELITPEIPSNDMLDT